jgi:hypothetical protein
MRKTILALIKEIILQLFLITGVYCFWNWLMPELIMAKEISLLQAWGIRTLLQFCVYHISHTKNENSNL